MRTHSARGAIDDAQLVGLGASCGQHRRLVRRKLVVGGGGGVQWEGYKRRFSRELREGTAQAGRDHLAGIEHALGLVVKEAGRLLARLVVPELQAVAGAVRGGEDLLGDGVEVEAVAAHIRPGDVAHWLVQARVPELDGAVPARTQQHVRVLV